MGDPKRGEKVNPYLLYILLGLVVFFLWMYYQGRTGKYWITNAGMPEVGTSLAVWPVDRKRQDSPGENGLDSNSLKGFSVNIVIYY